MCRRGRGRPRDGLNHRKRRPGIICRNGGGEGRQVTNLFSVYRVVVMVGGHGPVNWCQSGSRDCGLRRIYAFEGEREGIKTLVVSKGIRVKGGGIGD